MIINNEIVDTVMGAVLGFVASILGGWIVYRREKKNQESFAASLLYNDLKSIEKYLAGSEENALKQVAQKYEHCIRAGKTIPSQMCPCTTVDWLVNETNRKID